MRSKKQKYSNLQTTKALYEDANGRFRQAIKNKNFNEKAVAQGPLEAVKIKMEMQIMDKSKQCSNKRNELVKTKKRLLEG